MVFGNYSRRLYILIYKHIICVIDVNYIYTAASRITINNILYSIVYIYIYMLCAPSGFQYLIKIRKYIIRYI